jgi:DNA-binding NtrC family response regulator
MKARNFTERGRLYGMISERKGELEKHILMVDDKSIFCYSAAVALKKEGYRVSTARNGNDALEMMLRDSTIDLVLVDLPMSNMPDEELVHVIRESAIETPVAVISTWMDPEQVGELMKKGFAALIDKQAEPEDFVKQVRMILQMAGGGEPS